MHASNETKSVLLQSQDVLRRSFVCRATAVHASNDRHHLLMVGTIDWHVI